MRTRRLPFIALSLVANLHAEPLDLVDPHNYANQTVPDYITRDNTPPDNPITDLGATLGRVLFYDRRLSRDMTVSCASCHRQEHAFSDIATASTGVAGTTGRHSMRLVNARFSDEARFFWDERAASAEVQATQPIRDHVEMGFSGTDGDPDFNDLIDRLSEVPEYRVLFEAVYGDPAITESRVASTLAQFVRSIQSFDSRYDEGRSLTGADGPPFPTFTARENAGKDIFLRPPGAGGAGCAGCHQPPEFSIDPASRNNGVTGSLGGGTDTTNTRAPSLRDVVSPEGDPHGGFMHDASFATLEEVVAHYNAIPSVVPNLDPRLVRPGNQPQRLSLSAGEQESLVAFLRTLTGTAIYHEEKWSDPFDAEGDLEMIVLPALSAEPVAADSGTTVLVTGRGVPHLTYGLQSSADLTDWTTITVRADESGVLSASVPAPSSDGCGFFRFTYPPPAE